MYDPNTARFLTKDPVGHKGEIANLYLYCLNDPVNSIDPSGNEHFVVGAARADSTRKLLRQADLTEFEDYMLEDVTGYSSYGWDINNRLAKEGPIYYVVVGPSGVEKIKKYLAANPNNANADILKSLIRWDKPTIQVPGKDKPADLLILYRPEPNVGGPPAQAEKVDYYLNITDKRYRDLLLRFNFELGFSKAQADVFGKVIDGMPLDPKEAMKPTSGESKSIVALVNEGALGAARKRFELAAEAYPGFPSNESFLNEFTKRFVVGPAKAQLKSLVGRAFKELGFSGIFDFDDTILDVLVGFINDDYEPLKAFIAKSLIKTYGSKLEKPILGVVDAILNGEQLDNEDILLLFLRSVDSDAAELIEAMLTGESLSDMQIGICIRFAERYIGNRPDAMTVKVITKLLKDGLTKDNAKALICELKKAATTDALRDSLSALENILALKEALAKNDFRALQAALVQLVKLIPDKDVRDTLEKLIPFAGRMVQIAKAGAELLKAIREFREAVNKIDPNHPFQNVKEPTKNVVKGINNFNFALGGKPNLIPQWVTDGILALLSGAFLGALRIGEDGACNWMQPKKDMYKETKGATNATPIYGKAQDTNDGTGRHARTMQFMAEELDKTGNYKAIYLGIPWRQATGCPETSSFRKPDVIGIRKDGTIDAIEVESPTDNACALLLRMHDQMVKVFPEEKRGVLTVVRYNGMKKNVVQEKQKGKHIEPPCTHDKINKKFEDGGTDPKTGGVFRIVDVE